jgi:dTDP-glucose 4,6-dehydratase
MQTIIATGLAGFIGSTFPRLIPHSNIRIVAIDKLTYAGHLANLRGLSPENFELVQGDINHRKLVCELLKKHRPIAVVNFAAESHVDNSITGPGAFVQTNIVGVFNLLEETREYWKALPLAERMRFRFLQVSTDEVFGTLKSGDPKFSESTSYAPNSPYSASKAAADHLVRAWFHTYGLPTIITNCSNNYGPRQFPEKLIPRMVLNALNNQSLPIYGAGLNIRDWIHVEDHCRGIWSALLYGKPGESYCFGGNSERRNIDVVNSLCDILDTKRPCKTGSYRNLIKFVEDRAGHDFRYAIDDTKAKNELNYKRQYSSFEAGLEATVTWYLENQEWISEISSKTEKS